MTAVLTVRNGRVPFEEQHRHRLSNDIAAPDDDRVCTLHPYPRIFEHADAARRRTWAQTRLSDEKPPEIDRMESIYIFARVDAAENLRCICCHM